MKIFQRYNPLQVAKYVKILFRGRLYIKDVGAFEFETYIRNKLFHHYS